MKLVHTVLRGNAVLDAPLASFVEPDGASEAKIARLRAEVVRQAEFDGSKEACLHRRHESAAERAFFRALKEFRQLETDSEGLDEAIKAEVFRQELGSFLEVKKLDAEMMPCIRN